MLSERRTSASGENDCKRYREILQPTARRMTGSWSVRESNRFHHDLWSCWCSIPCVNYLIRNSLIALLEALLLINVALIVRNLVALLVFGSRLKHPFFSLKRGQTDQCIEMMTCVCKSSSFWSHDTAKMKWRKVFYHSFNTAAAVVSIDSNTIARQFCSTEDAALWDGEERRHTQPTAPLYYSTVSKAAVLNFEQNRQGSPYYPVFCQHAWHPFSTDSKK